jgi:hypothetical protein
MSCIRTFICIVVAFAAGCASVPLAPKEADVAAKTFEPPPGQANLYIYRNERFGAAARLSIALDGSMLGDTAAMTYLYTPIAPGRQQMPEKTGRDGVLECKMGSTRAPPPPAGCSKDTDCKGERICRAGVCAEARPLIN